MKFLARAWGKGKLQAAIIAERKHVLLTHSGLLPMRIEAIDPERISGVLTLSADAFQEQLLQLDVLSRFVFVLRALEGYSRRETSLLLKIDDRSCEWIYQRTLESLEENTELPAAPIPSALMQDNSYQLAQS